MTRVGRASSLSGNNQVSVSSVNSVGEGPTIQNVATKSNTVGAEPLLIKIGDKWINIETWKKSHPGGALCLERFRGQDATEAFESLHSKEAFSMVEKMRNVEHTVTPKMLKELQKPNKSSLAFREFRLKLEKEGWYERNWFFDTFYVGMIVLLSIVGSIISYQHPYIAIVLIGVAMQQAGWVAHDYVHGRGTISKVLGISIGAFCNGFSSRWWSEKHNKHHVHTNQFGIDDDIQNDPILHLWVPEPEKDHSLRAYQHIYYHIVYSFLYVSWRIQSIQYSWSTMNLLEIFMISINYLWLLCLPVQVSIGSIILGGFLVAEIVTATHQSEEILPEISFNFVEDQFLTTRDVDLDNPVMNYLWGGMQYQLEHHLFPTMPKYYYSALKPVLKQWAKENGINYRSSSLFEILTMNYETMKKFAVTKSH